LGNFLQISFSDGIRNQISESYREWEFIQRIKSADANGREHRFFVQTSYGPAAIRWSAISGAGSYPSAQQTSVSEATALFKEINATIELEYNLWNRAKKSPAKYAEPLAIEIQSKGMACKRQMSRALFDNGLGVLGEVADFTGGTYEGVDYTVGTAVLVRIDEDNTSRGHVGYFELGDKVQFYNLAGTEHKLSDGGTAAEYGIVNAKNRANNTLTIAWYDTSDNLLTIDGAGTVVDTDVLYRENQVTHANLSAITGDYNTLTEQMTGLGALVENDGRNVHSLTLTGALGGSRYSASSNPIDVSHIQKSMSQTKVNVGEGVYSYKGMIMSPEANDSLIESREVDRRFQMVEDNKRGVKVFAYVHANDSMEVIVSEFCPKRRIYMIPEAKNGSKVLEYHGSDFESVRPGGAGSEFFLRPSASTAGHDRFIRSYLEAVGCLICRHPAAINVIEDFTTA